MTEKILITGATGFIGYYVTRLLSAKGYALRLLVRPTSNVEHLRALNPELEFEFGDIEDIPSLEDAVDGCQIILHAAALVSFQAEDRKRLFEINTQGTTNIVDVALAKGIRRLIYISSVAALNRDTQSPMISERDRWQEKLASTPYAQSKFSAEREVWRGQAEGLSVAALYPSLVIGAGNWLGQSTPSLFHGVDKRRFFPTGQTGFVDVRDVATATLEVLQRDRNGDRFLLNAENLSWEKALSMIAQSVERQPPSIRVAPWLSGLAWPVLGLLGKLTGQSPTLTKATHRTAQSKFKYDGSLITREMDFAYRKMGDSIKETGAAYLASVKNGIPQTIWLKNDS
ncbi:MAG: NAD-dependent epimerase/dehydratase family protein [Bacteroidota bacterium]